MTIRDSVDGLLSIYKAGIYDPMLGEARSLNESEINDLIRRILELGIEKEEVQNALAVIIKEVDLSEEIIEEIKEEIKTSTEENFSINQELEEAFISIDESSFVEEVNEQSEEELEEELVDEAKVVDNNEVVIGALIAAGFLIGDNPEFGFVQAILKQDNIREMMLLGAALKGKYNDINIVLERKMIGEKLVDVITFVENNISFSELANEMFIQLENIKKIPQEERKYSPEIMRLFEEYKKNKKEVGTGFKLGLEDLNKTFEETKVSIDENEDTLEFPVIYESTNENVFTGKDATPEKLCEIMRKNAAADPISGDLPTLSITAEGDKRVVRILGAGDSSASSKEIATFVFEGELDQLGQNVFDNKILPTVLEEYALLNVLENQSIDQEFEDIKDATEDLKVISADKINLEMNGFPRSVAEDSLEKINEVQEKKKEAIKKLTVLGDESDVISKDEESVTIALDNGVRVTLDNSQVGVLENEVRTELEQVGVLEKAVIKEKNDDFSSNNTGISDAELLFYLLASTITIVSVAVWYLIG